LKTTIRCNVIEEYITGDTLRTIMENKGPMSEQETIRYIQEIAEILRPLHEADPPIVHRDIKPENLIRTREGSLYLVDLNSAKESSGEKETDTVLFGTKGYAAPEQYGFSSSGTAADIYALGVMMNEMLTGKLPSEKKYKGKLSEVINQCLKMEPSERYRNADEFLAGLGNVTLRYKTMKFGKDFRKWAPPGLDSYNPIVFMGALLWYIVILYLTFGMKIHKSSGGEITFLESFINRLFFFLFMIFETMWVCNWHGCHKKDRPRKKR